MKSFIGVTANRTNAPAVRSTIKLKIYIWNFVLGVVYSESWE